MSDWKIQVGVNLDTAGIQSQLNKLNYTINAGVNATGITGSGSGTRRSSGTSSGSTTSSKTKKTQAEKEAKAAQKQAEKEAKELAEKQARDLAMSYQVANAIFRRTVQLIGKMASETMEVNKATTEFKKVSDLTGSSLTKYTNKLAEAGTEVARTKSEMVEAATQFRKSGFTDAESATLATTAAMFQNISDTEITASEAAASITSQIRAFGWSASDATHIVDAYNEVANNFSVGTNDLSKAMEVASSGMAVYGNSFEEILGLVTAGSEIMTGRSLAVSRGLNTIAARITKNTDLLAEYGIQVEDSNGNLKSTYQVLAELKPAWDAMSDAERTSVGDALAGTNQFKVLASVMANFSQATKATTTALNSAGSAAKENAKYMESLEAKTTAVSAAWQNFASNVIDEDLIGGVLDKVSGLLQGLSKMASADGGLISKILLGTGVAWGGTMLLKVSNILPVIVTQFGNAIKLIKGASFASLVAEGGAFAGFMASSLPIILAVVSALAALYVGYKKISEYEYENHTFEGLSIKSKEASEQVKTLTEEVDNLRKKNEELEEQVGKTSGASNKSLQETIELNKVLIDIKTKQIQQQTEQAQQAAKDAAKYYTAFDKYILERGSTNFEEGVFQQEFSSLQEALIFAYNQAVEAGYDLSNIDFTNLESAQKTLEKIGYEFYEINQNAEEFATEAIANMAKVNSYLKYTPDSVFSGEVFEDAISKYTEYYNILRTMNPQDLLDWQIEFIKQYDELYNQVKTKSIGTELLEDSRKILKATQESGGNIIDFIDSLSQIEGMDYSTLESVISHLTEMGELDLSNIDETQLENLIRAIYNLPPIELEVEANTEEAEEAAEEAGTQEGTLTYDADMTSVDALLEEYSNKSGTITYTGEWAGLSFAKGTDNAKGGMTLVNEEGAEIIQSGDRAYIAGKGNPTLAMLKKGDRVFTADETKQILNGNNAEALMAGINARANGLNDGYTKNDGDLYYRHDTTTAGGLITITGIPSTRTPSQIAAEEIARQEAIEQVERNKQEALSTIASSNNTVILPTPSTDELAEAIEKYRNKNQSSDYYYEDYGGTPQRSASELKEEFNEWLKAKKHALAMDEITEAEYYDDLEKMYKEYFEGREDLQEEYWKYEEEIYKWRKEQQDDEITREEKLNNLAKAKAQRTKVFVNGQYQYISDRDAVASAMQALKEGGYANGTTSATAGIHLVGERGAELRVIGQGDGIIPADATKNLLSMAMGNTKGLAGKSSGESTLFNISNITLPNVLNAEQFVADLKNLAYQRCLRRA